MSIINAEILLFYKDSWQDSSMPEDKKEGMVKLADVLLEKAKGNEVKDAVLRYPEDCDDFDIFLDFAYALDAYVKLDKDGKLIMCNFGDSEVPLEVE